jgi:hypothetical protein
MAWKEWKDTQGGQMDYTRKGRVQRVFKVYNGVSAAIILATPELVQDDNGNPLPAYNTIHPNFPDSGIRLEQYQVDSSDGTLLTVTALYSNDRRWKLPNVLNVLEPTFKSKGASYETRTIEIPYGKKVLFDASDGPPKEMWRLQTKPVIHRFMRFTYRCNTTNYDGNAQEAIRSRIGDLHKFGFDGAPPRYYQFSGCDATQQDHSDGWTLEYEWTRDPGTPYFAIGSPDYYAPPGRDPGGGVNPDAPWFEGVQWARPPFTELGFYPTQNPGNGIPEIIFPLITPHAMDEDGYLSLPGVVK